MHTVGNSRSNASYLFAWKLQQIQKAWKHCLIEQILSYKTLFFNILRATSYHFCRWWTVCCTCKSLYQWMWPAVAPGETHHPQPHGAHVHCWVFISTQQVSVNVSGCHFFLRGGIQFCTFALYALPCQMPCCQTVPLLPSCCCYPQQQHGILVGRFNLYCHIDNVCLWCCRAL